MEPPSEVVIETNLRFQQFILYFIPDLYNENSWISNFQISFMIGHVEKSEKALLLIMKYSTV